MRSARTRFDYCAVWLVATSLAVAVTATAAPEAERARGLRWQRLAVQMHASGATAVAREANAARIAVGDERGVLVGPLGATLARRLAGHAVADLAFGADSRLWVATSDGLWVLDAAGRARQAAVGPGASARTVTRVVAHGAFLAAATEDGAFVAHAGSPWQRLAGAVPSGSAQAVGLRARAGGVEVWTIVGGELWRVALAATPTELRATASERSTLPPGVRDDRAIDLQLGLGGLAAVVAFPAALAVLERGAGGAPAGLARTATPTWVVVRPQIPPGASIRRLAHGAGRFWLATDRGLLEAIDVRGPWRRSAPPAGGAEVASVAALDGEILVAAREAVFLGRPEPAFALGTGAALPPPSTDPPIEAVHRAAIHYVGLGRGRLEAMRRAVRRRGYWPVVTLRGGGAWDRDRGVDHDQAFVSGDMRFLVDRDWGRNDDYDVQLTLTWDLRDNAFDPEAIDVSEETRDLIELRDDVLDEVTQLYFERRAVLAALFTAAGADTAETHRLRLRADELAAGIDAWTGGWFSARVAPLAP